MTTYNMSFNQTEPFSDLTVQIALATSTVLSYTVPGTSANSYRADFSIPYDASVWIGYNIIPILPSAGVVTPLNRVERINNTKYARYVRGGDILYFISELIVDDMGISFLSLPG